MCNFARHFPTKTRPDDATSTIPNPYHYSLFMHKISVLLILFVTILAAHAQSIVPADMSQQMLLHMDEEPRYDHWRIDSSKVGNLYADFDALTFFKDNEWHTPQVKGYTLPGARLTLKATYLPIPTVALEAGIHGVIYNGSNKYPAYVFHDIATWKGDQYQSGIHPTPWIRAQAQFGSLAVVLGNLYGGASHRLIEPLYNPEVNITADPEMGVQVMYDHPHYELDAWVDWQSFIYEADTHQEAFTFGMTNRLNINRRSSLIHYYIPIQTVVQHRGGEQNLIKRGVQTIANVSAGLGAMWQPHTSILTRVRAEADVVIARQVTGELWPWKTGTGGYALVGADLYERLGLTCSFFSAKRFVPLYGAPFFSTISTKFPGTTFDGIRTLRLGAEYTHHMGRGFSFGAKGEAFISRIGGSLSGEAMSAQTCTSFSFGIYLRFTPRFRLL